VRARDHWVEDLGCPNCRKTGVALLSDVNEYSLDIRVDAVPEGFEIVRSKHGIEFYCASCEIPVDPQMATSTRDVHCGPYLGAVSRRQY
jgi:hypothetical protein